MKAALWILGLIVLVPFVLGFIAAFCVIANIPCLCRWMERRVEIADQLRLAKLGLADWPPTPARPIPKAPAPPAPPADWKH